MGNISHQGYGLLEVLTAMLLMAYSLLALLNGLLNAQQYTIDSLSLAHENLEMENEYEQNYLSRFALDG